MVGISETPKNDAQRLALETGQTIATEISTGKNYVYRKKKGKKTYTPVEEYKSESTPVPVEKPIDSKQNTVIVNNQGYSVDPALQKEFVARKQQEQQYKQFTTPRSVSPQETQSVPLNVDISNLSVDVPKKTGGSINARRVGDFANKYDDSGNRLTPTPSDVVEMKIVGALGGGKVVAGVVSGVLSPARLGETLFMASNFNDNSLNQQATQSKIKKGVLEVIKDPFGKLIAEPVTAVANDPLFEAPKLATELVLIEGASRGVKSIGSSNKFSKSDVQASAYDISRSSEKAQIFLKENEISASSVGTPEFVSLPQLTVDISRFNKNQKYFSDPQLDVGVDRQFTLAGTELKPPVNKKGVLPLDEETVAPFESNLLTINVKKGGEVKLTPFEYAGYLQEKYPKFDGIGFDVQSESALGTTGENIRGHVGVDVDINLLDSKPKVQTFTKEMDRSYWDSQQEDLNSLIGTKYIESADSVLAHELVHAESRLSGFNKGSEIEAFTIMNKETPLFLVDQPTVVKGSSTAQSRVVDLPVSKSFNKDTVGGTPIVDLQNPERSSLQSESLTQLDLTDFGFKNPIENKVSSVPKGSNKPLIFEKVKPVENKPIIDNSFAFESDGSVLVAESNSLSLPARSFGSEKRLKVNADYVYDSGSGEYIRKAGDVELNLDIKGKVTSQNFGVDGAFVILPKSEQPSRITPRIDPIKSPMISTDSKVDLIAEPKISTDLKIDITSDQRNKQKSKTTQSPKILIDQVVSPAVESKLDLKVGQDQVQRLQPKTLLKSVNVDPVIKPLLPKLKSDRQVKSGSGLFDVLVRKGGKFVLIGSGYSDLATAFNRGRQEVKNTARASFKVVSRFGEPQKFNINNDRSLTRSKRDANVIVQKREFRISSQGEKTEISRKGVFTKKLKSKGMFKG